MSALFAVLLALAPASPLDPLEDAVRARWEGIGPGSGVPARDLRALGNALLALEAPRASLLDDLRAAGPAARRLDRAWPEFAGDLAAAFAGLRAGITAERDALAGWAGHTGSARGELLLERGIAVVDRRLDGADRARERAVAARRWRRACGKAESVRSALGLALPKIGPTPFAGLAPDFSLLDANPLSPGTGLPVSPRDHAGRITAWYFTRLG
jgi:hypothetical protein